MIPTFAYNYACIMSREGDTDKALEWLEHAYKHGAERSSWVFDDPDLDPVRMMRPDDFKKLTTTQWSWGINWDFFSGDTIRLTNNSAFPLTGVRLTVSRSGSSCNCTYKNTFSTDSIPPGGVAEWKTNITCRTAGAAENGGLVCDQLNCKTAYGNSRLVFRSNFQYGVCDNKITFSVGLLASGKYESGVMPAIEKIVKEASPRMSGGDIRPTRATIGCLSAKAK